jgi:hypothetical protein
VRKMIVLGRLNACVHSAPGHCSLLVGICSEHNCGRRREKTATGGQTPYPAQAS